MKFQLHHHFEELYKFAQDLIADGKAYVDSQSNEAIREQRGTLTEPGQNSPFRDRSVEENRDLFARMRAGEFADGEHMTAVLAVPEFEPGLHVLMATRNGTVKKTDLMAFSRPRTGGIIAMGLADDDELIFAKLSDGTQNVFLGTASGKSIRVLKARSTLKCFWRRSRRSTPS